MFCLAKERVDARPAAPAVVARLGYRGARLSWRVVLDDPKPQSRRKSTASAGRSRTVISGNRHIAARVLRSPSVGSSGDRRLI